MSLSQDPLGGRQAWGREERPEGQGGSAPPSSSLSRLPRQGARRRGGRRPARCRTESERGEEAETEDKGREGHEGMKRNQGGGEGKEWEGKREEREGREGGREEGGRSAWSRPSPMRSAQVTAKWAPSPSPRLRISSLLKGTQVGCGARNSPSNCCLGPNPGSCLLHTAVPPPVWLP